MDFSRSDAGVESRQATAEAAKALVDVGKGTSTILKAAIPKWKVATEELEEVATYDEYVKVISSAIAQVSKVPEVQEGLNVITNSTKKSILELLSATQILVLNLGYRISNSEKFKQSLEELIISTKLLIAILSESSGRIVSGPKQLKP